MGSPKGIILEYMKHCKPVGRDADFWKDWNILVEYYEGRMSSRTPSDSPGNLIVNDLISPKTREGEELDYFYGAASVIWAASEYLGYPGVRRSFDILVDACRRARMAHCPLEVS